jgi:hypothetical protein
MSRVPGLAQRVVAVRYCDKRIDVVWLRAKCLGEPISCTWKVAQSEIGISNAIPRVICINTKFRTQSAGAINDQFDDSLQPVCPEVSMNARKYILAIVQSFASHDISQQS